MHALNVLPQPCMVDRLPPTTLYLLFTYRRQITLARVYLINCYAVGKMRRMDFHILESQTPETWQHFCQYVCFQNNTIKHCSCGILCSNEGTLVNEPRSASNILPAHRFFLNNMSNSAIIQMIAPHQSMRRVCMCIFFETNLLANVLPCFRCLTFEYMEIHPPHFSYRVATN